ncbi:MAG: type II toxin-antitoxin system HicA family toxin [Rhodobacteraceae bacterium]|nr:type II toxin-antitoxin system HicA family toxin [Paracoccaceae bacterium]
MDSKHKKTFKAAFKTSVSGTLAWNDIENLLIAVSAQVVEGSRSRVRFVKDGVVASFHRPHPAKEAKRYQVRDARAFHETIGAKP